MNETLRKKSAIAALLLSAAMGFMLAGCGNANYQEGVTRANDEIQSGGPCIYSISMADRGHSDPKTGLPYLVMEENVTPEMLKMIEGHNITIYAKYPGK